MNVTATALLWASVFVPGAADAQTYDPGTESLLSLVSAPADGIAYYEVKSRTRALVAARNFAEAEPLAEWLARDYPRDGENWLLLARIKANLRKPVEAAAAYERAGPLLGWGQPYSVRINAAGNHLAAGNRQAALDLLRREVFENRSLLRSSLYTMPVFKSLQADPEFLEIVGRPDTTGWTRDEGWRRDIDYLYAEVKRVNPDYHDEPFPAEFERRYRELKQRVPRLSDEEIYVGMNRMLAVLHQGHTTLWPSPVGEGRIQDRTLPVQFYAFPEGLYIVGATSEHRGLIGSRVLAVANTPVDEALRRVSETRSVDGDMEYVASSPVRLRSLPLLKGLGIVDSDPTVSLTVEVPDGEPRTVLLTPGSFEGMEQLQAPAGVTPPVFLRHVARGYWELPFPEHNAMYVQINYMQNDKEESLPAFGERLATVLSETKPANLIIDLRHNTGGSMPLYYQFLRTAVAFGRVPGNQLYVLMGRHTYSAASNLITDLERLADPIFVGEASSECCNFYGNPSVVTLPYSRVRGALTGVKWNFSSSVFDGRREMSPEVPVQLTAQAYFAGQDPALEATLRMIRAQRGNNVTTGASPR